MAQVEDAIIPMSSVSHGKSEEIAEDLIYATIEIVNICFVGNRDHWVLIDAGMPRSAETIFDLVDKHFGKDATPEAIILTHGHFDHVGALKELIERWHVPVYAQSSEIPFLIGQADYPEPDASVEGGFLAKVSPLFPNEGINAGYQNIFALPDDTSVPFLPEWNWISTPGHTSGHISLFRERDRALIAGDAFTTVRQDKFWDVIRQEKEISGPPRYLTEDWVQAETSVKILNDLNPSVAITGHGQPMQGEELSKRLNELAQRFDELALPDHGKYL